MAEGSFFMLKERAVGHGIATERSGRPEENISDRQ